MDDTEPEPDSNEEIELEMEEQNEKYLSEMNIQQIEIKMKTPTAPVEEEIVSNAIVHDFSDSNIPTTLVKSEVIESEEPVTEMFEPEPQEDEEIMVIQSETVQE